MVQDPWGTPVWLQHRDGPIFTIQIWTGPDGTRKLRIVRPWLPWKVEIALATPEKWRHLAEECAEEQPFRGKKLAWFMAWRAQVLGPTDTG